MLPIDKKDIEDILALTPMQEGILFHYLKDPESDRYFEQLSLELSGEINIKKFEQAWNSVIAANEMLRTVFRWEKVEHPVQIILKTYQLQPGYYDFPGTGNSERKNWLEKIKAGDRQKRFDLGEVPFRVTLCKTDTDKFVMIISNHHILYDGWSNGIILREFFQIYNRVGKSVRSSPPTLPPKTKFKEYVKWLSEQDKTRQKEFWTEYLLGTETGTRFPSGIRPGKHDSVEAAGAHQGGEGNESGNDCESRGVSLFHSEFPHHVSGKIDEFVKQFKITTASLLYSAWGILLHRYTHRHDLLFGTTVSGRSVKIKEIENIVGLFINTPPLRVMLQAPAYKGNGSERIFHLLQRINRTLIQREIFECTPLVDIKKYSQLKDKEELFNTIVVIENYPLDKGIARENNGLSLQSYSMVGSPTYDLAIGFLKAEAWEVTIGYHTGVMDSHTIDAVWRHFHQVLVHLITYPEQPVRRVEMLTDEEKNVLLYKFNDTTAWYPRDKTIHQWFQEQVRAVPDRIAVIFAERRLSYDELNRQANQLAYRLQRIGVKPGTIVGILLMPSLDRVVAMLAILKAGGAYLPIDPEFPLDRIITMLEDCQARGVISDSSIIGNYPFTRLKGLNRVRAPIFVTDARPQMTDLDSLPLPDRSLVNYDQYMNRIGQAWLKYCIALFSTRGCPFKCAYCHRIWPKKHVVRSAENIFAELNLFYRMGVRRFAIIDDIFNLNIKNSTRFFALIIKNRLNVQLFFPNGMRGDLLSKEYLDLMVEAGTLGMGLALETASPRLQKLIKKNLNLEKFKENLEYLCNKHPQVISELYTMHGFPTESEEEALMTLDFIKRVDGIHFPYINILRIYSNTDMYRLAVKNGISEQAIFNWENSYFHELPETLPFDKNFTLKVQSEFLEEYFLDRDRLLHVLPHQMKIYTEEEMVQKYNSYLMVKINSFPELLQVTGISREELGRGGCVEDSQAAVLHLDEKIKAFFPVKNYCENALNVLFLDVSQFFSKDTDRLDVIFDPPLGLILVMSYMNQRFQHRVRGKIVKSRVDFDSFPELRRLIEEFQPDIIGMRTLTYYRDFFHQTAALIRQWGFEVPIVAGGPYASSNFNTILQDSNIDVVVLGEGEVTFSELIEKILENGNRLPGEAVLKEIKGLAFVPDRKGRKSRIFFSREIIMADEIRNQPDQVAEKDPVPVNNSADPAYVMYTSGSTGKPKGVMVGHGNVVNNLHWFSKTFHLDRDTHLLQLSDYTFDPSVEDIFGSLVHGGTLYLSDKDLILDRERFRRYIRDNDIHIIDHVPPMLDELLGNGERLPSLRAVITGGMRLEQAIKDRLVNIGYPLYNHYGPTEITVDALFTRCSRGDVILGKPIFNTICYIVDRYFRLVPIGVVGELCIAGAGVARGYINNPELTGKTFLQWNKRGSWYSVFLPDIDGNKGIKKRCKKHPPERSGQKVYCTGDLARWLIDGNIEFSGRMDRQVKVRGNRVELGEIEAHLCRFDHIKGAVVRIIGQEGDIILCAYLVKLPGAKVAGSRIKEFLSRFLPDYMIPAYFVFLEAFPLTAGGKVDMSALPVPGKEARDKSDYAPPGDGNEQKLVEIWSEILELPAAEIGIDDDFFKLGGHSLRATKLTTRVHRDMNVKISIVEIFDRPTIRGLAQLIKGAEQTRFSSIQPMEDREYYPVSPAQKRMFIVNRFKDHDINDNINENINENINDNINNNISDNTTDVLLVSGELDTARFEDVFKQLVTRHQAFMTSFEIIADEPVQRIHAPADIEFALDYYDSSRIDIHEFLDYFIRPFDLAKAPLIRVALIQCPDKEHILVMDTHHIIWDGGSKLVLMKELEDLSAGKELPGLRLRYTDYSCWQNRMIATGMVTKQEEYWMGVFAGDLPRLDLPLDFPRPATQSFAGDTINARVDNRCCEKVDKLVEERGATYFMVLLAVFYILLSRYGGDEDIIIGTPVVGRPHADLEHIIGMFVNMLALRNFPNGEKTFREFLQEVKNTCLQAYENQDYQFDQLVEKLGIHPDPSRGILFDVVFAIHNRGPRPNTVDNPDHNQVENCGEKQVKKITFENYDVKEKKVQFDILFYVYVGDGITLDFRYVRKLFKPSSAEKMVKRYVEILEQVTGNPEILLKDITVSYDLITAGSKSLDQFEFGF